MSQPIRMKGRISRGLQRLAFRVSARFKYILFPLDLPSYAGARGVLRAALRISVEAAAGSTRVDQGSRAAREILRDCNESRRAGDGDVLSAADVVMLQAEDEKVLRTLGPANPSSRRQRIGQ